MNGEAADSLEAVRRFRARPWALCLAAVLGAVSGAAAGAVRWVFRALQWGLTQGTGTLPMAAAGLPWWRRALTPVVGAACAMVVVAARSWWLRRRRQKPRAYGEYVEAVRVGHGQIPFGPNVWRTGGSAFSVATGASIGREGSMIQFAAATTALLNRWMHRLVKTTRAMPSALAVACGVAAGVTAAYNAPVAGMFFAAEIVLGEATWQVIAALAVAAASSWGVSRELLGAGPLYPMAALPTARGWQWVALAGTAVAMGALGPVYQQWLRLWGFGRKAPGALLWGGLAVGLLSVADPRVWGNGDVGLAGALGLDWTHGTLPMTVAAMAAVLGLRLLATGIVTGVGTVGGVFTPTMFAGATLAALAARVGHLGDPALFAVVGLAALVAAATHAPLMAAFMAVELTGQWKTLPELLAAGWLAWMVAARLSDASLYAIASQAPAAEATERLRQRAFPLAFTLLKRRRN